MASLKTYWVIENNNGTFLRPRKTIAFDTEVSSLTHNKFFDTENDANNFYLAVNKTRIGKLENELKRLSLELVEFGKLVGK